MIASQTLLLILLLSSTTLLTDAVRTFAKPDDAALLNGLSGSTEWVADPDDERSQFILASQLSAATRDRYLSRGSSNTDPYASQNFVDGSYEYDEYQQAWRYLGFVIDCDASQDDDYNSGSGDGGTGEGCHRYVLWAAYVDLEYEGGGIGEYQYWDKDTQDWDANACNFGGNGGGGDGARCAKMDCHLEDTHFSLLGFFKHKSYDDWMEQLFKHEGMCVWTSSEYAFMSNAREAWPGGCTDSGTTTSDGSAIYYDIKPTTGGGITLGLYTDTRCVLEYAGDDDSVTVENVVGNFLMENGGSGSGDEGQDDAIQYDSLEDSLAAWDSAFGTWKTCHPCVAYDLNNVGYDTDDDYSKGSSYWMYNQDDYYSDDDTYSGGDWGDFDCYDDADYTNVNQCMKFMAKTTMNAATYRDLSLAKEQATLVDIPLSGSNTGASASSVSASSIKHEGRSSFLTIVFFCCSCIAAIYAGFSFLDARKRGKKPADKTSEYPLMASNSGTLA